VQFHAKVEASCADIISCHAEERGRQREARLSVHDSEHPGVIFCKRDEITTDLICCDVEVAGHVCTFREEATGW